MRPPTHELYPKEYLPGRGITRKVTYKSERIVPLERFKDLEHYSDVLYYCVKCGQCRSIYQEPGRGRTCPSGDLRRFEAYYLGGKNLLLWGLLRGKISWSKYLAEILYHCTLCGNCAQQCQVVEIHYYALEWLEAARREAVRLGFGPMPEHKRFGEHTAKEHNPYLEPHEKRWDWLPFNKESLPEKAEVVYFVGCTSSYRQKEIAIATVNILKKLGVNFTILWREGFDEWCCGSPLERTGQVEIVKELAEHNIAAIERTGANTVITSCAGCYRMLKEDYRERYGLKSEFDVLHMLHLILDYVKKGKLKLKELKAKVTYHDPCHLGRHMGVYEEPRELLRMIPGLELIEMERTKENAWCCGAGGGVMAAFKELASYAAHERVLEAERTGADILVSSCPFCWRNLNDDIKRHEHKISMKDITELILEAME